MAGCGTRAAAGADAAHRRAQSLRKQIGTKVNAEAATDAAMKFADTRCKVRVQLGEGGRDYIYHSIHGIKKAWFNE